MRKIKDPLTGKQFVPKRMNQRFATDKIKLLLII